MYMLNITSYVSLNVEERNRKKSVGGLLYKIIEYTHKTLHNIYSLCYKLGVQHTYCILCTVFTWFAPIAPGATRSITM